MEPRPGARQPALVGGDVLRARRGAGPPTGASVGSLSGSSPIRYRSPRPGGARAACVRSARREGTTQPLDAVGEVRLVAAGEERGRAAGRPEDDGVVRRDAAVAQP